MILKTKAPFLAGLFHLLKPVVDFFSSLEDWFQELNHTDPDVIFDPRIFLIIMKFDL